MSDYMEQRVEQHEDTPEIAEHPLHCICTSCATERLLDLGQGRFDKDIASHLHHVKQVRDSDKNTLLLLDALRGQF